MYCNIILSGLKCGYYMILVSCSAHYLLPDLERQPLNPALCFCSCDSLIPQSRRSFKKSDQEESLVLKLRSKILLTAVCYVSLILPYSLLCFLDHSRTGFKLFKIIKLFPKPEAFVHATHYCQHALVPSLCLVNSSLSFVLNINLISLDRLYLIASPPHPPHQFKFVSLILFLLYIIMMRICVIVSCLSLPLDYKLHDNRNFIFVSHCLLKNQYCVE